jgi:hypothetical protein
MEILQQIVETLKLAILTVEEEPIAVLALAAMLVSIGILVTFVLITAIALVHPLGTVTIITRT